MMSGAATSPGDLWFGDAPSPTGRVGGPNSPLSWVADPDDGAHVWALAHHRVAWQQLEHADELRTVPDVLLHSEGYRLRDVCGVRLPPQLDEVVEGGPDALTFRTQPLDVGLVVVDGVRTVTLRREFGPLTVDVLILEDRWHVLVHPGGRASRVLVRRAGAAESGR